MRTRWGAIAVALAVAVGVTAACGCGGQAGSGGAGKDKAKTAPAGAATGGTPTKVLMLGRSVMGAWFSHWGYDGTNPVVRDGLSLTYREVEGPDGIARSASEAIAGAEPGSTVFFKFCFVDFTGSDDQSARDELERNEGFVREVVAAAEKRGVSLIIGNALPQVASQSNSSLVREHRAYNAWLDKLASEHSGTVRVFDEYSVLAGANGALRPDFASAPDDAHPNDKAYDALDEAFFAFMGGGR